MKWVEDGVRPNNILYIHGTHTQGSLSIPISDITIEGIDCVINTGTTFILQFGTQSNITFRNLDISYFYCITKNNECNIKWENCSFRNGIGFSFFSLYAGNDNWVFMDNTFDTVANGIYTHARGGVKSANNLQIINNTFSNMTCGLDAHAVGIQGGTGHLIEGNVIDKTGSAILFYNEGSDNEMGNHIIRNNTITNTRDVSSGNGIAIYDPSTPPSIEPMTYLIEGNVIEDTFGDAIVVVSNTQKPFIIKDNVIRDSGRHGIRFFLGSGVLTGEITGNQIINPVGDHVYPTSLPPSVLIENNVFE